MRVREARALASVVAAATLWGISGVAAQELFVRDHVDAWWLVAVRIDVSAVLLLAWTAARGDELRTTLTLGPRGLRRRTLVFALVGLLGVQATYFLAVATGSAVTATLLQFTSPILILVWHSVVRRSRPRGLDLAIVAAATGGIALVVGPSPGEHIGLAGVAWGLASAVATALYNLAPARLYDHEPPKVVVTRAFVLAAVVVAPLALIHAPRTLAASGWGLVLFVAVVGTAVPFALYLTALQRLAAFEANVVGTLEPIVAAATSIAVGLAVASWQMASGIALVIAAVLATTTRPHKAAAAPEA